MLKRVIALAGVLALSACVADPAKQSEPLAQPQSAAQIDNPGQCVDSGGRWGRACKMQVPFCFVPSLDAGKGCNDSSECQNRCLKAEAGKEQAGFVGVCQADNNPCGCFAEVKQGKSFGTLCID